MKEFCLTFIDTFRPRGTPLALQTMEKKYCEEDSQRRAKLLRG